MRTRIKICGITRADDAALAATLGVDAIGLVFYEPSPRFITIEQAQNVAAAATPFVTRVGLFMDAAVKQVEQVIAAVSMDLLQFHGSESVEYCESFDKPYIKSVPMLGSIDLPTFIAKYPSASGFLLDAVQNGDAGGQGQTFPWSAFPAANATSQSLILAGGLQPENVAAAIVATSCYAVDVSSGVESEKGIKSAEKMQQFVNEVQSVNE